MFTQQNTNSIKSIDNTHRHQQKKQSLVSQKSLKSLKSLTRFPNPTTPTQHDIFQISSKDIDKLYQLMNQQTKSQQHYQEIDNIFCRYHLSFFQSVRGYLSKEQYKQLIDRCEVMCYAENRVIAKKGNQDQRYYVLIDGMVSYNEERVSMNLLVGREETEYTQMALAQKGQLLNAETLNAPKHNTYTVISHSTVTVIGLNATEIYSKLLKKYFIKELEEKSYSLSNTSLFKGISSLNIMRLMPYFFNKNFYKFNEVIYKQNDRSDFVYWILQGEVQLIKEDQESFDNSVIGQVHNNSTNSSNRKVCKIVKLSKYQIFGIDQYVFKPTSRYLFTARVCSQSLKTLCISYKSLAYIQSSYPCLNENIDFYLKRASAMHSKIVEKNYKIMEVKENVKVQPMKKKGKGKRKGKGKKNPESMEWWGLAQNTVGNMKYKLQLPKFTKLESSASKSPKSQPMFDTSNYRTSKIEDFRRKIFQKQIDEMIEAQERRKSVQQTDHSPYKVDYMPKLNKLKVKMLDVRPKAVDNADKVKKKLLSYAKNFGSFCDKLNLD